MTNPKTPNKEADIASEEAQAERSVVMDRVGNALVDFAEAHPDLNINTFLTEVGVQLGLISRR